MCGIAGILYAAQIERDVAIGAVDLMCNQMYKRGPDALGTFLDQGLVLGHRRLSILDLSPRSNQPLISSDGLYSIVFNGEIYNYRELRAELEGQGIQFRTNSDTEVLLELFKLYGKSFLLKLQGMFAFAIWNQEKKSLFLARDAYGIKPLYYSIDKDRFIFSSQVKALQASNLVSDNVELAGLTGFYLWGSVPEPWTCVEGIFALEAGHNLTITMQNGRVTMEVPQLWHDIRKEWLVKPSTISFDTLGLKVKTAVTDSVKKHLVSDVPVGIFLSGGIDSAVVAGIASQFNSQIEGITIGFKEFEGGANDEVPLAHEIAKYYGLKHHTRIVTQDEFLADLPLIQQGMDQPSIDGINTWFASKAASELGYKVILSGIGGDELFAGYPSFSQIPRFFAFKGASVFLRNPIGRMISKQLARYVEQPKLSDLPSYSNSIEGLYFLKRALFVPSELPAILGSERAEIGLKRLGNFYDENQDFKFLDGASEVGMLESTKYLRNQLLRDSDWASMAHSLELRTPLVDSTLLHEMAQFTSQFSRGIGKRMLANSPSKRVPESIVEKPKTGFSTPMNNWLKVATTENYRFPGMEKLNKHGSWARKMAIVLGATLNKDL